jgi:hypothetical protein
MLKISKISPPPIFKKNIASKKLKPEQSNAYDIEHRYIFGLVVAMEKIALRIFLEVVYDLVKI